MGKIRVLVADDAVVIRRLVSECLGQDPEIEMAGTAANGVIALAKITQTNPDVVILDVEMPSMNGMQALVEIRKTHPKLPVIMFSTLTERGASATLDALAMGANDYVTKPSNTGSIGASLQRIREELIPRIKGLCRRQAVAPALQRREARPVRFGSTCSVDVLAVGVSTGGPNALSVLLPGLARNFPVPVVMVQHMPALFTRLLAERLTTVSGMPVREGYEGASLRGSEVWLAPGGFHMEVQHGPQGLSLHTHQGPAENSCRPAVDVLFRSAAATFGAGTLAVVMTGMGQDGLRGCETIREAGGQVLAQDEQSSIVWGMPGAVSRAGLADKVLPLQELATEINRRVLGANALVHRHSPETAIKGA